MAQRKRRFEEVEETSGDDDRLPGEELEPPAKKSKRKAQQDFAKLSLARQMEAEKRLSMQPVEAAPFSVGKPPNRRASASGPASRRPARPSSAASTTRTRRTPSQQRPQPPLSPSSSDEGGTPLELPGSSTVFEFGAARRKSGGAPAASALGMSSAERCAGSSSQTPVQRRRSIGLEIAMHRNTGEAMESMRAQRRLSTEHDVPAPVTSSAPAAAVGATAMRQRTGEAMPSGSSTRGIAAPGRHVAQSPWECGLRQRSQNKFSSEAIPPPRRQDPKPARELARLDIPRRQSSSLLSPEVTRTSNRSQIQVTERPSARAGPKIIASRRERPESWASGADKQGRSSVEIPEAQPPAARKFWLPAILGVLVLGLVIWGAMYASPRSESQRLAPGRPFECPPHAVCVQNSAVSCEPPTIWVLDKPSESKTATGCVLSESVQAKIADVTRLLDEWSWPSACKDRHGVVTPTHHIEAERITWFKYDAILAALNDQASPPSSVDVLSAAELSDVAQGLLAMRSEQASDDEEPDLLVGLFPTHPSGQPLSCLCAGWISGAIELVISAVVSALEWLVVGPVRFVRVVGVALVLENPVQNCVSPAVLLGVLYVLHARREHRRGEEQLASGVDAAYEEAINFLRAQPMRVTCAALIETLADNRQDRSLFKNRFGPRVLDRLERDHRIKLTLANNEKCMQWDGPVLAAS